MKPKCFVLVGLACLMLVGPSLAQQQRRRAVKAAAQPEQPVAPATPPPTMAQMPASAPQVAFQSGELTISAQNSTLGDILKAVKTQTGATIELPGSAPERVVGTFGPGPARDVLSSLLNGSHFNYLLLGSPTDPNALDRVILMAKSSGATENNPPPAEQASAYNQPVYNRPIQPPMAAPGGNTVVVEGQDAQDDSATDDQADAADDTTDDQTDDQATEDQATDDQAATEDTQGQQQAQPVKSPEQMLQELQQRQQQMQQGGQPGVPPGFPNPGGPPGVPGQPVGPHN